MIYFDFCAFIQFSFKRQRQYCMIGCVLIGIYHDLLVCLIKQCAICRMNYNLFWEKLRYDNVIVKFLSEL